MKNQTCNPKIGEPFNPKSLMPIIIDPQVISILHTQERHVELLAVYVGIMYIQQYHDHPATHANIAKLLGWTEGIVKLLVNELYAIGVLV